MESSFLADLDDLSDDAPDQSSESDEDDQMDEQDIEKLNYDDLTAVAKLNSDAKYADIMQRVRAAAAAASSTDDRREGSLEDDPTYKLLVECNRLAVDIDNEIIVVHNFLKDKYRLKFPELESLVHHPIDYARVVTRIGNEMDLTLVNLDDLLPAATIMVVTVTATTTSGKALSEENLQKTVAGAGMALELDEDKKTILEFVESRMHKIAPNLSAVVGTEVAAKLMGVAGGLLALSKIPACNVQVLGARRKNLVGMSSASVLPHQGFVSSCPMVLTTPPSWRRKAAKLMASKCTLMARMDAFGQDPGGLAGGKMHAESDGGGRRLRKMKERYGLTDVRKAANRMNFNVPEEEYIDGDEVIGLGVLGSKEGTGRLKIVASQSRLKISAKNTKKLKGRGLSGGGMSTTSGLSSSLAFTPVQGIELENPSARVNTELDFKSGTESYFSEFGGFRSISKGRLG
ncbi:MAG: hypothetical protein WDW38_001821 [Sanguina aurantia]